MAGPIPPHRISIPVSLQRWDCLTFLHWPLPEAAIQPLLPPPLRADLWDGQAWVGLTPFVMNAARAGAAPLLPGVSRFPETNLRTYVVGPDGDGVWFLSMDAARLAFVSALRVGLGLPYLWSDMRVRRRDGSLLYTSRRRRPFSPAACSRIQVRPGQRIPAEQLADFDHYLTGRWSTYSLAYGWLWNTPIAHHQWPLRRAEIEELDDQIVQAAGLPDPADPAVAHYSPGVVDVRIGMPRLVR